MTEVADQTLYQQRRHLDLADDRVATATQQATHSTCRVTVVHNQGASGRVAQEAATVLRLVHLVDLLGRESVLPLEPGTKVLLPSGLWIRPAPLTQAFISPLAVRLAVLAVAATRALAALTPTQPPIGERIVRQIAGALLASGHAPIMPRDTNTQALDQHCHADVLLELANAEVLP